MGSYDRDYARKEQRKMLFPQLTPVVKWLLIANVAVFLFDMLIFDGRLDKWFGFSVANGLGRGWIWQFVSCQFIHRDVLHLLMNSLGLFFIGPMVERWWGSRYFLHFYLVCGVAGSVFYTLLLFLGLLPNASSFSSLAGASAGVFGLIFAIYVMAPARQMRLLFPPITVTVRQIALFLVVLAAGTILGGLIFPGFFTNEGGEAAHLGGAIMGFYLMKYPWLVGKGTRPGKKIIRPKQFRRKQEPKIKPRSKIDLEAETEIDRILDKINDQGLDSLTKEESMLLEGQSKKK